MSKKEELIAVFQVVLSGAQCSNCCENKIKKAATNFDCNYFMHFRLTHF